MSLISQSHTSFQQSDLTVVKEERFVFETEWFDAQAELIRKYLLTYYPGDRTCEMVSTYSWCSNLFLTDSTILKTEECSWREWPAQVSHQMYCSSDLSSTFTLDNSSSLNTVISSLDNNLNPNQKKLSQWSNLTVTLRLVKLLMPFTKTVSPFQNWRWANSLKLNMLMSSTLSTEENLSSLISAITWHLMLLQEWNLSRRMLLVPSEMSLVQLIQPRLRFRPETPLELTSEPMVWETLSTEVDLALSSRENHLSSSLKLSLQLLLSTTALAPLSSHILFNLAKLVKWSTWYFKKVLKSVPCKCSVLTNQLPKSSSKYTRVYFQNS